MVGKTALGRYRLRRPLGQGSNAQVYLADCLDDPPRQVVVKRIHDHVSKHPHFRQLFAAEVESMANFTHPYVVRLLEASIDNPHGPCLVMEYVPGVTLEQVLELTGPLDPVRVCYLAGYLCHALQAAHDSGVIHRDLKPSNLMVLDVATPRESLKVMDFGFAGFAARPYIQLAELTGRGPIHAMGTPSYVSPEMIRGDRVDARSDLYSVGVILYELLTGRLPFDHTDLDRLLTAHLKDAPPPFHKVGAGHIPDAIEAVVQLALAKYPNERHQSARELLDRLGRAVGVDLWEATAPEGYEAGLAVAEKLDPAETPEPTAEPADPFQIAYRFEAVMPERLAAAKLRGFVEDLGGQVLASDPGLIRLRLGVPPGYRDGEGRGNGLLGWLRAWHRPAVPRGQEPIELELHLERLDPSQPQLNVLLRLAPMKDYPPADGSLWSRRCETIYMTLRQYLGQ